MRIRSILSCIACTAGTALAFQLASPGAPLAAERQAGEDRWVPSFAISSGVSIQTWDGFGDSTIQEGGVPPAVPLRGAISGDDLAVEPFVGATVELMGPALPIPTRPRLFVSAGLLPTFGSDRVLALEGDPDCVRGPQPSSPCAKDEVVPRAPGRGFGESVANGVGSRTNAEIDTLVYTASAGLAFPFSMSGRQLRIKPSFGWVHYEVDGTGLVVNAWCQPANQCVDEDTGFGFIIPGFVRVPDAITATGSKRFHGIGPGIELEMDAARFGPVGFALFGGASAYYILGERSFDFAATEAYSDLVGVDVVDTRFEVEVDEWMYRANVGIRFQWLGRD